MYDIHMEINKRIAQRIKSLLKDKGKTQIDLADMTGISLPTIRAKFASQIRFSLEDLEDIARALNVPLVALFVDQSSPLASVLSHADKMQSIAKALDAQKDPHDLFVAIQTVIDIHRTRDAEKERQTENV